jgi:chemotaxis protein MotA
MDKNSFLGFSLVIIAIVFGIMFTDISFIAYLNVPSMFVVFVGTLGAVMMSYRYDVFINSIKNIKHAFSQKEVKLSSTIDECSELAQSVRNEGVLAAESYITADPFFQKSLDMLVDGLDDNKLEESLAKEIFLTRERNNSSIKVLNSFSELAPALGMIGTLIGLVAMLMNMDDPKSIGSAMAVALLTTLYGALMANCFSSPLAKKLSERSLEIYQHQSLVKDAVVCISKGENPRYTVEYIQTYLDHKYRK